MSFKALTWNIEGLSRNIFNLKHFLDLHQPDLAFLSEPQIFTNDIDNVIRPISHSYRVALNSVDEYDPYLPLIKSKAFGGTMVLWKTEFDPFITIHPVSSSAFLPVIFHPPNTPPTVHIAVYLPTSGKESMFMEEISKLEIVIDDLCITFPEALFYLRGDFNVSQKNIKRTDMLNYFCNQNNLQQVTFPHPTYHHFIGNGESDSYLDKILFSNSVKYPEVIQHINCKLSNPLIESHHDMIVSLWTVPLKEDDVISDKNTVASKVDNDRVKVAWTDEGIAAYQRLVIPNLSRIQELWSNTPTRTSVSLLLESTTNILSSSAFLTNKTYPLKPHPPLLVHT